MHLPKDLYVLLLFFKFPLLSNRKYYNKFIVYLSLALALDKLCLHNIQNPNSGMKQEMTYLIIVKLTESSS